MEGPSLIIFREEAKDAIGKKILAVSGNGKIDQQKLINQKIIDIKSWGKHLLICFKDFTLRVHFLMFGSYRINEVKEDRDPRLTISCKGIDINLYSCAIKFLEEEPDKIYDWSVDVMSDLWDHDKAVATISSKKKDMICDLLMDQDIFAGVGNIIKNEVLYRVRLHPERIISDLDRKKIEELVKETRNYCFDFYEWKKIYMLRKNWLIYKKLKCRSCKAALTRRHTGKLKRYSWFCEACQT